MPYHESLVKLWFLITDRFPYWDRPRSSLSKPEGEALKLWMTNNFLTHWVSSQFKNVHCGLIQWINFAIPVTQQTCERRGFLKEFYLSVLSAWTHSFLTAWQGLKNSNQKRVLLHSVIFSNQNLTSANSTRCFLWRSPPPAWSLSSFLDHNHTANTSKLIGKCFLNLRNVFLDQENYVAKNNFLILFVRIFDLRKWSQNI